MKQYNKYLVSTHDKFMPEGFSSICDEVQNIREKTINFPAFYKAEIIVSFLKDHYLQNNWIDANPDLTVLVSSGELFTGNIESLFESCRNNPGFRKDLEDYLTESFTNNVISG